MRGLLLVAVLVLLFVAVLGQTTAPTTLPPTTMQATTQATTNGLTNFIDRLKANAVSLGNRLKEGAKQVSQTVRDKMANFGLPSI